MFEEVFEFYVNKSNLNFASVKEKAKALKWPVWWWFWHFNLKKYIVETFAMQQALHAGGFCEFFYTCCSNVAPSNQKSKQKSKYWVNLKAM